MNLKDRVPHPLKLKIYGNVCLLLLLVGGLAWFSLEHPIIKDISANGSNTLAIETQKLLAQMQGPVHISAYIDKGLPLRKQISQLINRYAHYKPDIHFNFIDPASQPEQVKALDIGKEGAVVVRYQGKSEKITFLSESSLSNTLLQMTYHQSHWISFLTGHGERDSLGTANFDLGEFGTHLQHHQKNPQPLNLSTIAEIPSNSALLVLSEPNVNILEAELNLLREYIVNGGNLLILTEPNQTTLDPLLLELGVKRLPGTLVDNKAKLYGLTNPSFVLVNDYPTPHAITQDLETMSLFPETAGLMVTQDSLFKAVAFLTSSTEAWNETGPLHGTLTRDETQPEQAGPLTFGLALTRQLSNKQQRIVVIGDGDFLANSYLGNVGNLDLGLRIIKWLVQDDHYLNIPAKLTPDSSLKLSPFAMGFIGLLFLCIIPLTLFGCGFWIWRIRKRR